MLQSFSSYYCYGCEWYVILTGFYGKILGGNWHYWFSQLYWLIHDLKLCSQNVDVNGPHHGPYQLMASSSLHCHRLVECGRHNELEAFMVGAVYVHVLRTLISSSFNWIYICILEVLSPKIMQIQILSNYQYCFSFFAWFELPQIIHQYFLENTF